MPARTSLTSSWKRRKRLGDAFVDEFLRRMHADLALDDASAGDHAAGDVAAFGKLENLPHFGGAHHDFLEIGSSKPAMASFTDRSIRK